jgi:hypothetical protein
VIMRRVMNVARYQTRLCIFLAEQRPNGLVRLAYIRLAWVVQKNDLEERSTTNITCLFIGAVLVAKKVVGLNAKVLLANQRDIAKSEIGLLTLRLVVCSEALSSTVLPSALGRKASNVIWVWGVFVTMLGEHLQ